MGDDSITRRKRFEGLTLIEIPTDKDYIVGFREMGEDELGNKVYQHYAYPAIYGNIPSSGKIKKRAYIIGSPNQSEIPLKGIGGSFPNTKTINEIIDNISGDIISVVLGTEEIQDLPGSYDLQLTDKVLFITSVSYESPIGDLLPSQLPFILS